MADVRSINSLIVLVVCLLAVAGCASSSKPIPETALISSGPPVGDGTLSLLRICLPRDHVIPASTDAKAALADRLWDCQHICQRDSGVHREPDAIIIETTDAYSLMPRTQVHATITVQKAVVTVSRGEAATKAISLDRSELERLVARVVPQNTAEYYSCAGNHQPFTTIEWRFGSHETIKLTFGDFAPDCLANIQRAMFALAESDAE